MTPWIALSSAARSASRWPYIVLMVLAALGGGCRDDSPTAATAGDAADTVSESGVTPLALQAAIDRSAQYLVEACDAQGQFAYRIHLESSDDLEPQYNVLRHAGAVYALAQYCQLSADPRAKAALLRAATFLRQRCIAPAANNPNFLAVWSDPVLVGGDQPRLAKLGGTGLGLAALVSVEQVEPGFTPLDELRKLGRFLVFMQKSDGSFYSKFYPETGRNDDWQSMYYPGEVALGLLMLYEKDASEQWLHTATKALENLALRGTIQNPTLPDQWYLLSLDRRMKSTGDRSGAEAEEALLEHCRHLCRDMVREQQKQLDVPQIEGCFTPEGRTCPSATRLEGLLAALAYIPSEEKVLRRSVCDAVERGLPFLLRSQIVDGPHAGAMPRFAPGFSPQGLSESERLRLQEVRIDYVQHALSAMIAYRRTFFPRLSSGSEDVFRSGSQR